MADRDEFLENAMAEIFGEGSTPPADKPAETPPETPPVAAEPEKKVIYSADAVPVPSEPVAQERTPDDILKDFNKITGMNFDNLESVKSFTEKVSKLSELEEQSKLIPDLINTLEKLQNPLNYFTDETAFKVSQLAKNENFHGKENVLNEILRSDLNNLSDLKIIELAALLNAPSKMRNPLNAEIRAMGLDPESVVGQSDDDLDDDTKDTLLLRANQYRKELSKLGEGVSVPTYEGTVVERLLNEKKALREDRDARITQLMPVASGLIKEIKEIPVTEDYKFQLELTPAQVESYSKELIDLMLTGQYDLATDVGKQKLFAEVMQMFKSDYFDKVVTGLASHIASSKEEQLRREYSNERPLRKGEPAPVKEREEKDWVTQVAEKMVAQGF